MKHISAANKHRIRVRHAAGETIDALAKAFGYTYHQVDYAIRAERRKESRMKKASSLELRMS